MQTQILVVDDETAIADLIEVYLKNENFMVHKFYSGKEALKCAREEKIDLAVLDVMLPDMDGFEICREIRQTKTFPIIMLTAKEEEIDNIVYYIDVKVSKLSDEESDREDIVKKIEISVKYSINGKEYEFLLNSVKGKV